MISENLNARLEIRLTEKEKQDWYDLAKRYSHGRFTPAKLLRLVMIDFMTKYNIHENK